MEEYGCNDSDFLKANFENLAHEIVMQAVKDYYCYSKASKKHPDDDTYKARMAVLENFFKSEWFITLMQDKINGETLFKQIRNNCDNNQEFIFCRGNSKWKKNVDRPVQQIG